MRSAIAATAMRIAARRPFERSMSLRSLLHRHQTAGFLLEAEVLGLLGRDGDAENLSAFEPARGLVFLTDRIAAVPADAESVAAQRELPGLRFHRPLRDELIVDVQLRGADR